MAYSNLWLDRRSAAGKTKPLLYLIKEITIMLLICVVVALFKYIPMNIIVFIAVISYFFTSSLPRYKKAVKRQKHA